MAETLDAPTATASHPLEPLSPDEIRMAVAILRDSGRLAESARFQLLTLHEPPKETVTAFRAGTPFDRQALAVVVDRVEGSSYEAMVSLTRHEMVSWERLPGHAAYLLEELSEAIGLVKTDQRWQEALRARGVDDFDAVQCDPWPAGNFGLDGEDGRRLTRVISYVRHTDDDNGYAHPIEGVVATVDVVAREVLRVDDYGVVPVPSGCANYDTAHVEPRQPGLQPLDITQPDGPGFVVEGNEVRWQRWRFRVSMHALDGLVLHAVAYDDGGELRPILHRAGLAEMVVPYGEKSPAHRWKNAFDSGELALGRFPFLNSLVQGCDCLGEIRYLDAVQVDEQGEPTTVANAICLHEEDYGILWKHFDMNTFNTEVRRSRRLVVSSIHTVGNYEYGFYWYFYLDGTMQLEVKLTGILQTMAVAPGEEPVHSRLVAPQLAAPHHQHMFCIRLDLDVDGASNSVYECQLEPAPAGDDNTWGNAMVATARLLGHESEAQRVVDPSVSRHWRVENPSRRNAVGQPVAYRLLPGAAPTLLARPGSAIASRAAFATKNLWVTAYDAEERRAAGLPNLSAGGGGLPALTAGDRSLEDTDVVLWFTFGLNHVARPEDWPVMPVEYTGFMLQPFGFFDQNPALDIPPSSNGHCD